ncbi:ABC transporter ATP-binding protein [Elioraea rosea]|uniref:ABC transporter ATP-binding protein n=1 Tax=Elioraea rosea TaxID=2492390 RepID=UPI0011827FFA|nr:ABC transporter ATP-binding protein [Elioraea rosea]
MSGDGSVTVRDLSVRFGRGSQAVHAVRGVSFSVAPGESFGLVGESGSGKSTVLRVLAGLNQDWQGTATISGLDVASGDRRLPRIAQMVFQDPYASLHPRHTVDRTLAEPLAIHGIGDASRRVEQALMAVGLGPGFRFRYPNQLSGGQRQRVAIARALMLEPSVLLLDEPTSALDVSVQAEILNLLHRLRRERGLTMLLVSHNLAVIAHMCDRLAVMNRGAIVEEMAVAALRRGEPREAYTRQLLLASLGYDRAVAASMVSYD